MATRTTDPVCSVFLVLETWSMRPVHGVLLNYFSEGHHRARIMARSSMMKSRAHYTATSGCVPVWRKSGQEQSTLA
eukprot:2381277-Pyramimonas_sp.AAC.1